MNKTRIPSHRVFVGNLDYRTTAHDLRDMLSGYGEVVDVYFPKDSKRQPPTIERERNADEPINYGCAFVEFRSREQTIIVHTLKDIKDPYDRPIYISNAR